VRFHCLFLGEGAPTIPDGSWDQIEEERREESDEERRGLGRTEGGGGTLNYSELETGLIFNAQNTTSMEVISPRHRGTSATAHTASTRAISSAYSH
jgi:hypothetical protein